MSPNARWTRRTLLSSGVLAGAAGAFLGASRSAAVAAAGDGVAAPSVQPIPSDPRRTSQALPV